MALLSRKRDLVYLLYFVIHIPVMFFVDLYTFHPAHLRPAFMTNLRQWYIATYADKFFTQPPAWFDLYMWMELVYHVPLSFWAVGALVRKDPKVPIHLLIYAVQTALTTATCIADYLSWSGYSYDQKIELGKLYVPYLAVSIFMAVDMFGRLNSVIGGRTVDAGRKDI